MSFYRKISFQRCLTPSIVLRRCSSASIEMRFDPSEASTLNKKTYLELRGRDCRKLLQGLCTNDMMIESLGSTRGSSIFTAFLGPKGRILADTLVINVKESSKRSLESMGDEIKAEKVDGPDDHFLIEVDESMAPILLRHLKMYKLRSKVKFGFRSDIQSIRTCLSSSGVSVIPEEFAGLDNLQIVDSRAPIMGSRTFFFGVDSLWGQDRRLSLERSERIFRYMHGIAEGKEVEGMIPLEVVHMQCIFL